MKWQQYKNTNEEDQKINKYESEADTQSIISYDHDIKSLDQSRLERKLRKNLKILLYDMTEKLLFQEICVPCGYFKLLRNSIVMGI